MPNHVMNEVIFRGLSADQITAITAKACRADGSIDFEVLVPSPINIWPGSVGQIHEKTFPDTHLNWATKNWSTKWNAYGDAKAVASGGTLTLQFETAWNPPYGWLVALFNTFKLDFEHNWLSEGRDRTIQGYWKYRALDDLGGEPWEEHQADDATHRRIYQLHWGEEPEAGAA